MINENRKKLLNTVAGGTGVIANQVIVPGTCKNPIIKSVLLPAHAQSSIFNLTQGTTTESQRIEITDAASGPVAADTIYTISIPSSDEGATGQIRRVELELDITHKFLSDFVIALQSPYNLSEIE